MPFPLAQATKSAAERQGYRRHRMQGKQRILLQCVSIYDGIIPCHDDMREDGRGQLPVIDIPLDAYRAEEEFVAFRDSVSKFLDRHAPPDVVQGWREEGCVPRSFWRKAGEAGFLCLSVAEAYGGMGGDFRHEVVLMEEIGRRGIEGWDVTLHNAITAAYIERYGTDEQKQRWLPRMATGELISAIAMSEPGTGSDLKAIATAIRRDGPDYIVRGSKTFITNGQNADLIIVVGKTDPDAGSRGISLIVLDNPDAPGFSRGRNLSKIGRDCADTSELFFDDVRLPASALLGEEGRGFAMLMDNLPQERLIIAVQAAAAMEHVLNVTVDYTKDRKAFGQRIFDFQNSQFAMAEYKTQATFAKVFVEHCVQLLLDGKLDSSTASMAKYWVTDALWHMVDGCLQLHGGYGFINEFPIAQAFKDARVNRIYGGTNEIMKLLIARTI